MLYELDVLEVRHIADLALDARKVRDRLLEKVGNAELGEPEPARGEHNPSETIVLDGVLLNKPEFVALREALAALPRDIQEKLWVVAQAGRGDISKQNWDEALAVASSVPDEAIMERFLGEADLHIYLRRGLYMLGATLSSGDVG